MVGAATLEIRRLADLPSAALKRVPNIVPIRAHPRAASRLADRRGPPFPWAEAYYDQPLSLTAVEQIYADTPLTESLVKQVSAEADLASVLADADEIGYPVAPGS